MILSVLRAGGAGYPAPAVHDLADLGRTDRVSTHRTPNTTNTSVDAY
ncbi:hypothetical protein [Mycobacterium sp. NPDC050853]|nr:hypothetical protein [Mycobacteroides sp. LB1]